MCNGHAAKRGKEQKEDLLFAYKWFRQESPSLLRYNAAASMDFGEINLGKAEMAALAY